MIVAYRVRALSRRMRDATIQASAARGDRAFNRRDRSDLEAWLAVSR